MLKNLLEKFESDGNFWLPDTVEKVIAGRLTFDPPDTLELSLSGRLSDSKVPAAFSRERYPIVHGQLLNGEFVTIIDPFVTSQRIGMGGSGTTSLVANHLLVGCLASELFELPISLLETSFTSIEGWADRNSVKSSTKLRGKKTLGYDLRYRFPKELTFKIRKLGMTLTLGEELNTNSEIGKVVVGYIDFLKLIPRKPITLREANDIHWQLQNLFSLLMGYSVAARFFQFEIAEGEHLSSSRSPKCSLLYLQTVEKPKERLLAPQMLLPFPLIQNEFSKILNSWFDMTEQAHLAIGVYFGTQYQPPCAQSLKFLLILQAIESYHRSLDSNGYMDPEEYSAAINSLLSGIPNTIVGDHRHSLKNRLKFGNELSLRRRLSALLNALPTEVCIAIAIRRADFVHKVVESRNFFTHYDNKSKGTIFDGIELFYVGERLRILLISTILVNLGVDPARLMDVIRRNTYFQQTLNRPIDLTKDAEPQS